MTVVFSRCLGVMATLDRLQVENSLLEQKEHRRSYGWIQVRKRTFLKISLEVPYSRRFTRLEPSNERKNKTKIKSDKPVISYMVLAGKKVEKRWFVGGRLSVRTAVPSTFKCMKLRNGKATCTQDRSLALINDSCTMAARLKTGATQFPCWLCWLIHVSLFLNSAQDSPSISQTVVHALCYLLTLKYGDNRLNH